MREDASLVYQMQPAISGLLPSSVIRVLVALDQWLDTIGHHIRRMEAVVKLLNCGQLRTHE